MASVIYVLPDLGVDGCVKIGKDRRWPRRFQQSRSHTPRGIGVVAGWCVDGTTEELNGAERSFTADLTKHITDGNEWFALDAATSISILRTRANRQPDFTTASQDMSLYDDWRSQGMYDWRARMWLFREENTDSRMKLIYSCLNDTIYQYAFTYNPYPVRLIAAWELASHLPSRYGPKLNAFKAHNSEVEKIWRGAMWKFAQRIPKASIGWLDRDVRPSDVAVELARCGLSPYDLAQAKPNDARPRDPSVKPVRVGENPPMHRIASAQN